MSNRFSNHCKYRGLTLIEVIASVALLSSLLVGLLSIHSRHVRQINRAFDKKLAGEHLDRLLGEWFVEEVAFPVSANRVFEGQEQIGWRSSLLPSSGSNPAWNVRIIRVEVFSLDKNDTLVAVDLVDAQDSRQIP